MSKTDRQKAYYIRLREKIRREFEAFGKENIIHVFLASKSHSTMVCVRCPSNKDAHYILKWLEKYHIHSGGIIEDKSDETAYKYICFTNENSKIPKRHRIWW